MTAIDRRMEGLAEKMATQRERERGHWKKSRKMTRSNLGIRLKARDSRPIEAIQAWFADRFKQKPRYNAIPANMRPWVPHRKKLIATGDWQALSDYAKALRTLCTKRQWLVIEAEYFGRLAGCGSEKEAEYNADIEGPSREGINRVSKLEKQGGNMII